MDVIRIATRKSPLALCQSKLVCDALRERYPSLQVEIIGITTDGDRFVSRPLTDTGGKALFIKQLEQSLLRGETDIAVHSMKDVPADIADDFCVGAMTKRVNPFDALVCNHCDTPDALPQGAVIGSASLRRRFQIKNYRPDLRVEPLRGNVNTRLARLDEGAFDAIVLACAGLVRLGIDGYTPLPIDMCLPAIGQGALGIECRAGDSEVLDLIRPLNDADTERCVAAERVVSRQLGADCRMPLAVYARKEHDMVYIDAAIGDSDGRVVLRDRRSGPCDTATGLGHDTAVALLAQGADRIISELKAGLA